MKYKPWKFIILASVILIMLALLVGCSNSPQSVKDEVAVATQEEKEKEKEKEKEESTVPVGFDTLYKGDMQFLIDYGFNGYVKYGNYTRIHAKVTNKGQDFTGLFQVIIPSDNNNNVMYQQKLDVGANDTQDVELIIPMNGVGDQFRYQFLDIDNKTVVEKTATFKLLGDQEATFIGVLSKNYDGFEYLESEYTKLCYLKKDNITDDYIGLDALDVIIIDNFDMAVLSDAQYSSIKQWVRSGGSLILGGSRGTQEEIPFEDLLNNTPKITENSLTRYDIEYGNIQIAKESLKLNSDQMVTVGTDLLNMIIHNLSQLKQLNYSDQYVSSYYNYRIFNTLRIPDGKEIPKVGGYILALFLYIVVVGPILYIILKKIDKRHLIWMLVPIVAVLFAVIVYSLGISTRVTKPYARYLTYSKIGEDGTITEDTYFSLTSPNNKEYQAIFKESSAIGAIVNEYSYASISDKEGYDYSKHSTTVTLDQSQIHIQLDNFGAFTPVYFNIKGETTETGSYEYDITDSVEEITGDFTNQLGYDLNNAAIMCNQTLICVGDIKDGDTIRIDQLPQTTFSTPDSIYSSNAVDGIAGGKRENKDPEVMRRRNAIEAYIDNNLTNMSKNNYLIAFSNQVSKDGIMNSLDLESKGMQVVIIPLNIKNINKEGNTVLPSIDPYLTDADGYYMNAYRYMPNDVLEAKYTFGSSDIITSIAYSKRGNYEFDKDTKVGFYGEIYFYNYDTKEYNIIFQSGKVKELTNLTSYLDEKNTLQVRYKADASRMKEYSLVIPVLTAQKEGN